jgi:Fe-S cluster assembly ATP-binding protein
MDKSQFILFDLVMLELIDYSVNIDDNVILSNLQLQLEMGKIYWLKGANGSGKSSLFKSLIGLDNWTTSGQVLVDNQGDQVELSSLSIQQRFGYGLFLLFQDPPSMQGVSIIQFLKSILKPAQQGSKYTSISEFLDDVKKYQQVLGLGADFYTKDMHFGLSGGEKKRVEMLQMLLLQPSYVLVDEIDSGLDEVGKVAVAKILNDYKNQSRIIVFTSHLPEFARLLDVDEELIIQDKNIMAV